VLGRSYVLVDERGACKESYMLHDSISKKYNSRFSGRLLASYHPNFPSYLYKKEAKNMARPLGEKN
jgi:hypothetical protein